MDPRPQARLSPLNCAARPGHCHQRQAQEDQRESDHSDAPGPGAAGCPQTSAPPRQTGWLRQALAHRTAPRRSHRSAAATRLKRPRLHAPLTRLPPDPLDGNARLKDLAATRRWLGRPRRPRQMPPARVSLPTRPLILTRAPQPTFRPVAAPPARPRRERPAATPVQHVLPVLAVLAVLPVPAVPPVLAVLADRNAHAVPVGHWVQTPSRRPGVYPGGVHALCGPLRAAPQRLNPPACRRGAPPCSGGCAVCLSFAPDAAPKTFPPAASVRKHRIRLPVRCRQEPCPGDGVSWNAAAHWQPREATPRQPAPVLSRGRPDPSRPLRCPFRAASA